MPRRRRANAISESARATTANPATNGGFRMKNTRSRACATGACSSLPVVISTFGRVPIEYRRCDTGSHNVVAGNCKREPVYVERPCVWIHA